MGNFEEIELRLFEILKVSKSKDIANILDVSTSTYGNWRSRNKIPFDEIITLCENKKLDIRYIFYGKKQINQQNKIKYKEEIHKMIDDLDDKKSEIYYHLIKAEILKENL